MLDATLHMFRAVGEETRLRIMALLMRGELTVTELTQILGQSQPRVSRHLKILADAGLVERYREGSWVFYRPVRGIGEVYLAGQDQKRAVDLSGFEPGIAAITHALGALGASNDRLVARDRERFDQSRRARAAAAAAYFEDNAHDWDTLRRLHLPEADIEARLRAIVGDDPIGLFVDIGTGAGRMLEIFADRYEAGLGFDLSREMLSAARSRLESVGVANAQVRHGDLFSLPIDNGAADVVCIHHVLHYLAEPGEAVTAVAKLLKPGGRLVICDFAPHELEFLRDAHAHRRLGFADQEVRAWCDVSYLTLSEIVTLSPEKKDDRTLTVKIWLCEAAGNIRSLRKTGVA